MSSEFFLPEWKIALDCGLGADNARSARLVLITHGHLDHIGGVARHAYIRKLTKQPPSIFVVPPELKDPLEAQIQWWSDVQRSRHAGSVVIALAPGESLNLTEWSTPTKGSTRHATAVKTQHGIPSQGYVLSETRMKIKPEYATLQGFELAALRNQGVELSAPVDVPLFAYTGDTTITPLLDPDSPFLHVPTLLLECTYLDTTVTQEQAKRRGHTHLEDLRRIIPSFKGEEMILTHFSQRHTPQQILSVRDLLSEEFPHIKFDVLYDDNKRGG